jgi:transcriptional regulator with XRE-family HTH domain
MVRDTPLRRWRLKHQLTQAALAQRVGVAVSTIARYEGGVQEPRGPYLDRMMSETGLPIDALMRPTQYLRDHPEFLADCIPTPH